MATEKSTPSKLETLGRATPRREPYWESVPAVDGLHVGFRCMPDTKAESWLAKWDDSNAASGRKEVSLRGYEVSGYPDAVKAAIKARGTAKAALKVTDWTVKQLCEAYTAAMEQGGVRLQLKLKVDGPRAKAADTMRAQQRRWISGSSSDASDTREYPVNKLAHVKLKNLTEAMCKTWREGMVEGNPHLKDSSINKELQCLRAPLNYGADVLKLEQLQTRVWKAVLEKLDTEEANATRVLLLTNADRSLIAEQATPHLRNFMKLLLLTSIRPGAAALLTVASFNYQPNGHSTLTIGRDKTKKATGRTIGIPAATAKWINDVLCADKIGNAPLLTVDGVKPWTAREWGRAFKKARNAAFPAKGHANRKACIYTLRHCAITDLIKVGQSPALIAEWAGTSVEQITKTYLKHTPADAAIGMQALAVNF